MIHELYSIKIFFKIPTHIESEPQEGICNLYFLINILQVFLQVFYKYIMYTNIYKYIYIRYKVNILQVFYKIVCRSNTVESRNCPF